MTLSHSTISAHYKKKYYKISISLLLWICTFLYQWTYLQYEKQCIKIQYPTNHSSFGTSFGGISAGDRYIACISHYKKWHFQTLICSDTLTHLHYVTNVLHCTFCLQMLHYCVSYMSLLLLIKIGVVMVTGAEQ